ncbi:MAG: GAF domain-containing protein [Anaerolineales bacterium]|nr:GAF domain-containing protein [Anaerolineales bacterium]
MIEVMLDVRDRAALTPVDWLILSTRALSMAALPLVAGYYGKLSSRLIFLLAGWVVFTMLASLLRIGGWRPAWLEGAAAGIEVVFAVAAIANSGGFESPLWWSLLVGPLRAGLIHGFWQGMAMVGAGILLEFGGRALLGDIGVEEWRVQGIFTGLLLLSGVVMMWFAGQVRRSAQQLEHEEAIRLNQVRERERERARATFHMAAELTTTLDYERVLEMALDLSARSLEDFGSGDVDLVSALLLFSNGKLHVASARGLTLDDQRITFQGESGLMSRALTTGEPRISRDLSQDPELHRLEALRESGVVLCIPLITGLDSYGIMIFAHREPHYFNVERVELLWAIAQQAIIALQNARLYRDLEVEKERITEIQEEARKKLARDLHDGPTQTIAAIAMRVNFARRLMDRDPNGASDELFMVEDMARRTTKEIRHMLFTLRPLILESQGLVAGLQQLAEKVRETHEQKVIIEADSDVSECMEMAKQGVVFYIAEEAINNARKHAEAEHVWVRLLQNDGMFVLEVEDDGVGFNVGAVDANYEQRGSLGIVNMRERAELVNGLLHIESTEGQGTCISVMVPLTEESAERLHKTGFVH